MKNFSIVFAAAAALAASGRASSSRSRRRRTTRSSIEKPDVSGLHDFDFLVGAWRVHHRRLKERLAGSHEWQAFDGTCVNRRLMDG